MGRSREFRNLLVLFLLAASSATATEGTPAVGSTIAGAESPLGWPVVVIDRAAIEASGLVSVGDILQDLPAQLAAINTQFNNGGDGSTRVNLRGIGSSRTLVLLNGRRMVPGGTGADASVDLNAIPLDMVAHIEILKRGASAVYGSDAMAGVVNIVTRAGEFGSQANAYLGTSGEGDGSTYGLGFSLGAESEDGGFIIGASYVDQEAVSARDRSFSDADMIYDYASGEAFAAGSSATPNGILDRFDDEFDPGNALYQSEVAANCPSGFCTRDPSSTQWRDVNPDTDFYNYQAENWLVTPSERLGLFASGHKSIGNLRLFGDLLYSTRESAQRLAPELYFGFLDGPVSRDSIYNPYDVDIFLRRRLVEAGPRQFSQDIDALQTSAGVGGSFAGSGGRSGGWTWEVSLNFGRVSSEQFDDGLIVLSRLADATGPSFLDPDGTAHCGSVDAVIPGCVPVDILGLPGSITPEMMDYIGYRGVRTGSNEELMALARISGTLLETSAGGRLSTAIGIDSRHVSGHYIPDEITASGDSSGSFITPTDGSYDLREAYLEMAFVPISGQDGFQPLEIVGAVRGYESDQNVSGVVWDAGLLWRVTGGVAFRGHYATTFRMPSIGELFNEPFTGFPFAPDPCDSISGSRSDPNVAARCDAEGLPADFVNDRVQAQAQFGGNPDVQEETAETIVLGVEFTLPAFLGLSVGIDWFDVQVDDRITSLSALDILNTCYFYPDGRRLNCDLISRDLATGFFSSIDSRLNNHGSTDTSGYDASINFAHEFDEGGRLSVTVDLTYLEKYEEESARFVVSGVGVYDLGAVFPRLKTQSSIRWDKGPLGLGANFRSTSGFTECEQFACFARKEFPELGSRSVSDYFAADLFASYQLKSSMGESVFRAGVNNISDESPPTIYDGFLADSDASEYDYVGRFFYLGLTHRY
ncbi:MAG TPA: TonB-dependent receptor [Steroidobacteraceae bacterium]|nr:TonB-dependent receptor [Steroidobacteraceae bacterium]